MKKAKTLLETIVAVPSRGPGRTTKVEPDPDVAIAWLKGEIKQCQIIKAIWPDAVPPSSNTTNAYSFINRSIRLAFTQGKIRIVE